MKKIEAIIRVEKLEELREGLEKKGFIGMTITEVKGRGRQKGVTLEWRVGEYRVEFLPKIKLEMVIEASRVNEAIETITKVCATGKHGDGKIFVSPIEQCIRVRTGESGSLAIG